MSHHSMCVESAAVQVNAWLSTSLEPDTVVLEVLVARCAPSLEEVLK